MYDEWEPDDDLEGNSQRLTSMEHPNDSLEVGNVIGCNDVFIMAPPMFFDTVKKSLTGGRRKLIRIPAGDVEWLIGALRQEQRRIRRAARNRGGEG